MQRLQTGAAEWSRHILARVKDNSAWHGVWQHLRQGVRRGMDGLANEPVEPVQEPRRQAASGGSGFYSFGEIGQFCVSSYAALLLIVVFVNFRIVATVRARIPYHSSPRARAIVRAPAIFLLARSCYLLTGMLVRMSAAASDAQMERYHFYHSIQNKITLKETSNHGDVLWSYFVAACVACASESFIRALDRDLNGVVPMNLFHLGMLLHHHSIPADGFINAPTRAVYSFLLISQLELLALQISAIPPWRVKLWITGASTIASRSAMIYCLRTFPQDWNILFPAVQTLGRFAPEGFFILCSLLAVCLRGLVQILSEGRLSMDVFGHSSNFPRRDDDFVLAVIRYGAATLESTAMKGLNNEVAGLSQPSSTWVELRPSSNSSHAAIMASNPDFPDMPQAVYTSNPLANEVQTIKAVTDSPMELGISESPTLTKEIKRFARALVLLWQLFIVAPLADKLGVSKLSAGNGRLPKTLRWLGVRPPQSQAKRAGVAQELRSLFDAKTRKRVGVTPKDDDDVDDLDYAPSDTTSDESGGTSSEDDDESESSDQDYDLHADSRRSREVSPAFSEADVTDLLQEGDYRDLTPMLIAHMQAGNGSNSPMTRQRYRSLMPGTFAQSTSETALTTAIAIRRRKGTSPVPPIGSTTQRDVWDDSTFQTSSLCVVCCTEQRSIVLWPCRCLALCNDCRSELAARSTMAGGMNTCPCCRATVQGYSRIHIP